MFFNTTNSIGALIGAVSLAAASLPLGPAADPPQRMRYQSRLLGATGLPVNQAGLSVAFALYDAPGAGVPVWSDTQILDVSDGLLSAELLVPSAVVSSSSDLFLGLRVDGDAEMVPRHRMVSVPFAYSAAEAEDVPGKDISPRTVSVNGATVIDETGAWVGPAGPTSVWVVSDGKTTTDGSVGINTSAPFAALHVDAPEGDALRVQVDGETRLFIHENGNTAMGSWFTPEAAVDVRTTAPGGAWNLDTTEGALRVGDADYRLKVGVATGGAGAGRAHLRAQGGVNQMQLGAGAYSDLLTIDEDYVSLGEGALKVDRSSLVSDDTRVILDGGTESCELVLQADTNNVDESDQPRITLLQDGGSIAGEFGFFDGSNRLELRLKSGDAPGDGIQSFLELNSAGEVCVPVLKITGGMDIVESFDLGAHRAEPGTVVSIDPNGSGSLVPSAESYDRCVAGVVSGAGGIEPGLALSQTGVETGDTPVAMAGRVYVKCTAENGPIRPGDRLTTATLAGHAMVATDGGRSDGAVIGKAMSSLDEGQGLVLVLVNLQ